MWRQNSRQSSCSWFWTCFKGRATLISLGIVRYHCTRMKNSLFCLTQCGLLLTTKILLIVSGVKSVLGHSELSQGRCLSVQSLLYLLLLVLSILTVTNYIRCSGLKQDSLFIILKFWRSEVWHSSQWVKIMVLVKLHSFLEIPGGEWISLSFTVPKDCPHSLAGNFLPPSLKTATVGWVLVALHHYEFLFCSHLPFIRAMW